MNQLKTGVPSIPAATSVKIVIAAFVGGCRLDSVTVDRESEISSAKAELLKYYPEAQICRKL